MHTVQIGWPQISLQRNSILTKTKSHRNDRENKPESRELTIRVVSNPIFFLSLKRLTSSFMTSVSAASMSSSTKITRRLHSTCGNLRDKYGPHSTDNMSRMGGVRKMQAQTPLKLRTSDRPEQTKKTMPRPIHRTCKLRHDCIDSNQCWETDNLKF